MKTPVVSLLLRPAGTLTMATNATTPLSFSTGRLPRNSKLPPPGAGSPRVTSRTAFRVERLQSEIAVRPVV